MDHPDKAVREMIAREIAPLVTQCEEMIRRAEAEPILLDRVARGAALAGRNQLRERLECLLSELHGVEERVLRLADERYPQWRTQAQQ